MGIIEVVIIVVGLMVFEVVSSIDNAVINAEVLATTTKAARRWFLTWGLLFSVILVRGLLPLIIVYASNPALGINGALTAAFSSDLAVTQAIEQSTPILLAGGGIYLLLLFIHWLIIEPKQYAFTLERHAHRQQMMVFYASGTILTGAIAVIVGSHNHYAALSVFIGAAVFAITTAIKTRAERAEVELTKHTGTDAWRKIIYLELIDTAFSIDGVLGAFAFTTAIPLILIGNGLGVLVIRHITMRGIRTIQTYKFLTNGAMYSIGFLSLVMLLDSYGAEVPFWVSPTLTIAAVAYFWHRSRQAR